MQKPKLANILMTLMGIFLAGGAQAVDTDLVRYAAAKENQVRDYAQTSTNKVPGIVWSFFDAVKVDDWETATNLWGRLQSASGRYDDATTNAMSPALRTLIWPPIMETFGTYEEFRLWDPKWLHRFGGEIIGSIPPDSIYFGGTDPGRFLISALSESNGPEKRFYILTQNQLVDQAYMDYLQQLYGKKIFLPNVEDVQAAFESYTKDAQERSKHNQLKAGENVRTGPDGRVQVSGQAAVMEINGLLARFIFDKNPGHEFFIEQSFPLDWMFPHLSPHGLIFQLHHKPLAELSNTEVGKDQEYWHTLTGELVGDWLNEKTSLKEICDFADKTFLDKNLADFKGDAGYAKNQAAQKCFSKLRSSQAGLYVWWADHAHNVDEKLRMQRNADLAYRQAYALCPYLPEAVYGYAYLLLAMNRPDDAFLIVKTSLRQDPDNAGLKQLMQYVRKAQ